MNRPLAVSNFLSKMTLEDLHFAIEKAKKSQWQRYEPNDGSNFETNSGIDVYDAIVDGIEIDVVVERSLFITLEEIQLEIKGETKNNCL